MINTKLLKVYNHKLIQQCFLSSSSIVMGSVPFKPRRSLMYVPGNDDRKVAKIPSLGADCVCLDCEDGVAVNMKQAARDNIRNILDGQNIDFGKGRF